MERERSAGVVLVRPTAGGRLYLLLHYESGHWDFVKGNVEEGERERDAAVRETAEETGIRDVRFVDGFREDVRYVYTRTWGARIKVAKSVAMFLAETAESAVTLSDEHVGHGWFTFEQAQRQVTFENARRVLERAEAHFADGG